MLGDTDAGRRIDNFSVIVHNGRAVGGPQIKAMGKNAVSTDYDAVTSPRYQKAIVGQAGWPEKVLWLAIWMRPRVP